MRKEYVRLINDFREPDDNEFFFANDPKGTTAMREMLNYLEDNFGFSLEEIEPWKIKTTSKDSFNNYDQLKFGYRIVRDDES